MRKKVDFTKGKTALESVAVVGFLAVNSILINCNVRLIASRDRLIDRSFGIEVSILRS